MEIKVGQAYVGKDGQWYYYTEKDVKEYKEQLIEKVIHQLKNDWYDEKHKALAIWLIEQIPSDKIEEYMTGVEE